MDKKGGRCPAKRGEVWLVNLDPTVGAEMKKTRHVVVLSDDSMGLLPLRIVVPLTDAQSSYKNYPWHVSLSPTKTNGITKEVRADAYQIRSVSEERFIEKKGVLPAEEMENIAAAVALCIGYV